MYYVCVCDKLWLYLLFFEERKKQKKERKSLAAKTKEENYLHSLQSLDESISIFSFIYFYPFIMVQILFLICFLFAYIVLFGSVHT